MSALRTGYFMKPDSAILLKQHPFVIPEFSEDIHHEIEIIIKLIRLEIHRA
jgi:2-keto-4-pentenoate hydratase/2-oxohepta-3-ene-1,7-dioic acid hydratase in catechol pathway